MKCQECIQECQAWGLLCALPDPESLCDPMIRKLEDSIGRPHRRLAHPMVLTDGFYRCLNGHRVEAPPADAMRAAGIPRLL